MVALFPNHVLISKIVFSFLEISNVSVLVRPHVNNFLVWLVLDAVLLKPLPTEISLRVFFLIELANEYSSTTRCPVLMPSTPIFLKSKLFLLLCVIGFPPVRSHVNSVSLKYS